MTRADLVFLLAHAPTGALLIKEVDSSETLREIALLEADDIVDSRLDIDGLWVLRSASWEEARIERRIEESERIVKEQVR